MPSHDKGHWQRGYSVAECATVNKAMWEHVGPTNGTTVAALARRDDLKGIPERSIRMAINDSDGEEYLTGESDRGDGVVTETFLCVYREQALSLTERMKKAVATMQARIERRERFAETLPWGTRPPDQQDLF